TKQVAELYGDALGSRGAFGRVPAGTALKLLGRRGEWAKVQIAPERFAFMKGSALRDGGGAARNEVAFDVIYGHAPPTLEVTADTLATSSDRVKIKVNALDDERLLDLYMFVGSRKLYYQSNRDGADPHRASFEFDAPLGPGV